MSAVQELAAADSLSRLKLVCSFALKNRRAQAEEFTTRLRALNCPVKVRYSAGKQDGMGCGQLAAETLSWTPTGGHMEAPPGIFTA